MVTQARWGGGWRQRGLPRSHRLHVVAPGPGGTDREVMTVDGRHRCPGTTTALHKRGGPTAWCTTVTCVTSSQPHHPSGLYFPLCGMGEQRDHLPLDSQELDPTKATETLPGGRPSGHLEHPEAGRCGTSAGWGALPPPAQATAQACPVPRPLLDPCPIPSRRKPRLCWLLGRRPIWPSLQHQPV